MIKVSKSQKYFFLKLLFEQNIRQNFVQYYFSGNRVSRKNAFKIYWPLANSQILYSPFVSIFLKGYYHSWDIFGFVSKSNFFVKLKLRMNDENHERGTHSSKMGADNLTKNIPNSQKIYSADLLNWPKSLGYCWKKGFIVHST